MILPTTSSLAPRGWLWVAIACFVVLLLVAALDDRQIAGLAARESPATIALGIAVSRIGLSGYMMTIAALVAAAAFAVARRSADHGFAARCRLFGERAVYVLVTIAGSGLACQAIKHLVGRARPKLLQQLGPFHFAGPTIHASMDSFPSGHTTTVFAVALAFSLLLPRWRFFIYAVALGVAVARLVAVAHFPSDVVAGAGLGTACAWWISRDFTARGIAFRRGIAPRLRPPSPR